MTKAFDFSNFSKQSPKGILVIYFKQLYTTVRLSWIILFFIIKDFSKVSDKIGGVYIYTTLVLILIFFLIRAYLLYNNFQFKITESHFVLKQGILKKTNTSIPFERIQNINFKQNIIQQIIGVHEVSIETAGSSTTEIAIRALDLKEAQALKQIILDKSTSDTKEILKVEEDRPLLRISPVELFKVSLTENHLRNLMLFLAVLIGFFQQIQQIADSFGESETLNSFIKDGSNAATSSLLVVLFMSLLLMVTAFITSFIRVFLVHFNLIAYLKKDAFEINQGLFTKRSTVLKKKKVQNITISTNPLKRLIGISYITFKQAISGKLSNKNKEKLVRIVGCKKEQVTIIKDALSNFEELENKQKIYPHKYYKSRLYFFSFLALLIGYIALFYYYNKISLLFSLLLVLPLTLMLIGKKLKKRFYKISEEMMLVGSGVIETHVTYVELFKVQNIKMKQSFFQYKRNVVDIVLQTASGKIALPCLELQEATKLYNYILYKVETSTKEWM